MTGWTWPQEIAVDISTPQISTHSVLSASDHGHGSECQHKLIGRDSVSHGFRSESIETVCVKCRLSRGDGDQAPTIVMSHDTAAP